MIHYLDWQWASILPGQEEIDEWISGTTPSCEVSFLGFTFKPYTGSSETAKKMQPSVSLPIHLISVNLSNWKILVLMLTSV
jgi:hypothetical protein